MFMRLLAPPTPSTTEPGGATSIADGAHVFTQIGCALCHTPTMQTGPSGVTASLSNANVNLYSDLLVHNMGNNLADSVSQGGAAGDEFRTAPLWGSASGIFFLHDGRSSDLIDAINQHAGRGSEANGVIQLFNHRLTQQQQQDVLNFLRSLKARTLPRSVARRVGPGFNGSGAALSFPGPVRYSKAQIALSAAI